jgi:hypothetical protein
MGEYKFWNEKSLPVDILEELEIFWETQYCEDYSKYFVKDHNSQ